MTMSPSTATPVPQPPHPRIPEGVFCAADYERLAVRHVSAPTYAYIAGGSGHDVTAAANREAYGAWAMCPRVLADVSQGHTRLALPGAPALAHPLLLAPVAYQSLAHPQGEIASAQAAEATQAGMVVSTLASHTLEDIARHAGPVRWFQLYLQPEREATLALLRRAEAAGYTAVVLTLDATIQVPSLRALRAGFRLPPQVAAVNLPDVPVSQEAQPGAGHSRIFQGVMRQAPTWADVDWLLTQTALPVWIKGVLHPDDAVALKARGVAGLVVSNHGGRGLDGAPASLTMLPRVRQAVGAEMPLLFDGGIRSGADVFKALALGANAVLIGRLQLYALAVAGALGVAHMLQMLRDELEICMAQAGCATLGDIHGDCVLPSTTPTQPRTMPDVDHH
jgi:isopentenyl diphosphate isomerase/L-lactate dehydrogenase-like FMN-dependent dehydrogenase